MNRQFQKSQVFKSCLDRIKLGTNLKSLGLIRSARLPVAAALSNELQVPILLVTDRADRALVLHDELGFWLKDTARFLFPEPTPMFYEQASWGNSTRRDRLQTLAALSQFHLPGREKRTDPIFITAPLRAVMTKTIPRRDYLLASKKINMNQQVPMQTLQRELTRIGYENSEVVTNHGQVSRRGGIMDIWTPVETYPVRLEFFGNEIDTLRYFDPATQRTIQKIEQLLITPAREYLLPAITEDSSEASPFDEFHVPSLHRNPSSILDYLPGNTLILIEDMNKVRTFGEEIEEQALRTRAENIQEGILPVDFPVPYYSWSELVDTVETHRWVELGKSTENESDPLGAAFQPGARFAGGLKHFVDYLAKCQQENEPALVASRQVSRLLEIWQNDPSSGDNDLVQFTEATLGDGWDFTPDGEESFHFITDGEIFGWERPAPRSRVQASHRVPESDYADLKKDDWVVHVDYGIGRFGGLVRRTLEGVEKEFLLVEYDGGDELFVPIHQSDRLSRYIGASGETPQPTRLGSAEWSQTKQTVREAVIRIAQELLELYAKRQTVQGYAFTADVPWQKELESSFPYVETDDQMKAIIDVKKDMEIPRPMDRLLCGDVGYGKTEVALRAAFKAVMDGKQVAVLVPTTVLAQQHFETFRQRLAPFPVQVEMLSRFRSPKEQDEIILRTMLGEVDIVIGTHRLLTADVAFKDLGLVIIDEEQRFGVTHKEHFKKIRTEVDVLTLTATPIPRTLYMALTGVRDISVINTPPSERLPIITHIGPYSPKIIKQAITREIERGGQVFFVHNRVQTIDAMLVHLKTLVPEARIGIAHGQMHEDQLSRVMIQFTHGEIDVLLCTSIIESGLDIPNANTLIVDRGDAFGLAQLYQLRGRVGRGGQRAYAYFFKHRKKPPTLEGQERLETIAENVQLGAGYSIAMRDLEMRGAGELLGTRQSGYIASVGFHLYTRMLSQAVEELQGDKATTNELARVFKVAGSYLPVSVDLPISAGIPVDTIPDQTMRLNLYRRMANLESEGELEQLREEFVDRFGSLVEQVQDLFYQIKVKLLGAKAGLISVAVESDQIVLRFPQLPSGVVSRDLPEIGYQTRPGKNAYWMRFDASTDSWRENLVSVLKVIASR